MWNEMQNLNMYYNLYYHYYNTAGFYNLVTPRFLQPRLWITTYLRRGEGRVGSLFLIVQVFSQINSHLRIALSTTDTHRRQRRGSSKVQYL